MRTNKYDTLAALAAQQGEKSSFDNLESLVEQVYGKSLKAFLEPAMPEVIIVIEGGVLQDVLSDASLSVQLCDCDNAKEDEKVCDRMEAYLKEIRSNPNWKSVW